VCLLLSQYGTIKSTWIQTPDLQVVKLFYPSLLKVSKHALLKICCLFSATCNIISHASYHFFLLEIIIRTWNLILSILHVISIDSIDKSIKNNHSINIIASYNNFILISNWVHLIRIVISIDSIDRSIIDNHSINIIPVTLRVNPLFMLEVIVRTWYLILIIINVNNYFK
jgi:hypothetical protein